MTRYRWTLPAVLAALALFGAGVAPATGQEVPRTPGGAGTPRAPAPGTTPPGDLGRFIVGLDVETRPEAALPRPEVAEQREEIAEAQAVVEAELVEGEVVRELASVPYAVVTATPEEIDDLQAAGTVTTAVPDLELTSQTDVSRFMIGAPSVWGDGDGTGQTIAILDTGVQRTHPYFGSRIVAAADRACFADDNFTDAAGDCPNGQREQLGAGAAEPCDNPGCDHGTHVAGIALADDNSSGDGGDYSGVAPGATLMPVRVFHDVGTTGNTAWLSDVLAGLQHVYDHHDAEVYDVAAVNMSLGVGNYPGTCNNVDGGAIRAVVADLTAAGVAVVASSGNDGSVSTMSFPSCVSNVISVGNVFTAKPGASFEDQVNASSNASPSLDLLAPGTPIDAAVPDSPAGPTVDTKSGTSMAAPHVAGAFALLRDARADVPADPQAVRFLHGLLDATGVCITDPGNGITYRRIQVDAANDFTGAPSALFSDVPSCAWYEEAVNWAVDEGYASGYDDNTFRGNDAITRAAVANMLWNVYGAPTTSPPHTFLDGVSWAADALDWISDPNGPGAPDPLAAGYDDGTLFRPGNPITRGELSRMLHRAAGSPDATGFPQPFSDVPPWLDEAVRWIADDPDDGGPLEPIATGYGDGTYRQGDNITRAAVVRMLQRFHAAVNP